MISALAHVVETSAPVYYTVGHSRDGVVYNNMVAGELYDPAPEDHQFLPPQKPMPAAKGVGWDVSIPFKLSQPGHYRVRLATVDTVGRGTVVWKPFVVTKDEASGLLRLQ